MKTVALILLAACTTSSQPDPHELVPCEGYTLNGFPYSGQCELACQVSNDGGLPQGSGAACGSAYNPNAIASFRYDTCHSTLEFDGRAGCCISGTSSTGSGYVARFFECQ